jgi:hypothetical protein
LSWFSLLNRIRGSGQAAGDEGANGGIGAGDGKDGDASGDGGCGKEAAWVRDAGGAGVTDDGDARAGLEFCGKFGGAAGLVVQVVADGGSADGEVVEQLLGLAGVLAGDAVDGAQDAEGAQGDVFKVADGRGHQVEARRERLRGKFGIGIDLGIRHAAILSVAKATL